MNLRFLFSALLLSLSLAPLSCQDGPGDANDLEPGAGGSATGGQPSTGGIPGAAGDTIAPDGEVTWHEHIAPLVAAKCTGCHTAGGIAPFALDEYEHAQTWGAHMLAAIEGGSMPPWGAEETEECTPPAAFKDDIRLSEAERDLFARWIAEGRLEGNPANAVPLPEPPRLSLQSPTRQLTIPSPVTVEGTSDAFVCFTLDPELTEDSWLTASQVEPGNEAIVHHALVFLDRAGQGAQLADESGQYECFGGPGLDDTTLLAAWAPGAVPGLLPEDTGVPLHPGDKLVVQVHYHPTGQGAETDAQTRVDLTWTDQEPEYIGATFLIGNFNQEDPAWAGGEGYGLTTGPDFLIPAGAVGHQEINRYRLGDGGDPLARLVPIYVWMVGTHMHYVGTDMKITVETPDGDSQCLVQTPNWDFNWQRGYFFEGEVQDLPIIHPGDSFTMRCTYDNSLGNRFVREALDDQGLEEPQDVSLGEATLDEMCLGIFGLAVHKSRAAAFGFN